MATAWLKGDWCLGILVLGYPPTLCPVTLRLHLPCSCLGGCPRWGGLDPGVSSSHLFCGTRGSSTQVHPRKQMHPGLLRGCLQWEVRGYEECT